MIHPHTYIHPNANIAMNVKIDPFVTIHPNVEIGEGTWVGSNVVIMSSTRIGKNCKIFPGAIIGAITQDLKFDGGESEIIIGDNTTIREFVTINKATSASGRTRIGKNVLLMAYCHIAHDCIIEHHVVVGNNSQIGGHVHIHEYARLGGMVGVQQHSVIGKFAFVGAYTFVNKDVPPFIKAARVPLVYVGVNSIGLRRREFSSEKIQFIQDIYRCIYEQGMITSKAIDHINMDFPPTMEKDEILLFIERSRLGIVKRFDSNTVRDEQEHDHPTFKHRQTFH